MRIMKMITRHKLKEKLEMKPKRNLRKRKVNQKAYQKKKLRTPS